MKQSSMADALRWITAAFGKAGVAHQLVGGLAARAYGATRPLNDIDFYVSGGKLASVASRVQRRITFGPERYRGERWDLVYMEARYDGWLIEVADAASTSFFDVHMQKWIRAEVDFTAAVWKTIEGIPVPVMPRVALIEYKRRLARAVDQQDIRELSQSTT